ncbi:hypothetical protein MSP7336_02215 [Mycobacterium shimoidei]|uniref:Integral membrane protein n=1 Tax=Mycobacterium shimoidei TaxID=29313 RepID=A0A375YYK1_MYCSH|nr:hypothetical protein [Mycobacterium shimoidei]SRX93968.1 hypothetical protein MSP7336_02215 [Mycobacterium shimoidei]
MTAVTGLPTGPFTDSTDSMLRFAMRVDATLTGLGGLLIAAAADPISSLTGLTSLQEYAVGAFFIFAGLAVFCLAALPDLRRTGIGVAIANFAFAVATVAVVAADVLPLSTAGIATTLAGGVYTAVFGYLQYLGVRRLPA